jgi:hypothetical protein
MLVPRTFMFLDSFEDFRSDFVGEKGGFDFLAEFGIGVLDNATVRTVGTVVRSDVSENRTGDFLRLYDPGSSQKEAEFVKTISNSSTAVERHFRIDLDEFAEIPRTTICYSTPSEVRELYEGGTLIDAEQAEVDGESAFRTATGIISSGIDRFLRQHWETADTELFKPIAKGGASAWIVSQVVKTLEWGESGATLKRSSGSIRTPNEDLYGNPGLTWTYIKDTGRRFGYYVGGLFSVTGMMLFPRKEDNFWKQMAILNSDLYHSLFLSQTIERNWNPGEIGAVAWVSELEVDDLTALSKQQYHIVLKQRTNDPISPFYTGPQLLPTDSASFSFFHSHPHTEIIRDEFEADDNSVFPRLTISGSVEILSR